MQNLISKLHDLNVELIPAYYNILEQPTKTTNENDKVSFSKILTLDLRYFDLVAINILMSEHRGIIYTPDFWIADIACNMLRMGNDKHNMFGNNQVDRICADMVHGRTPDNMLIYQLLNQILRHNSQQADIWLVYMLPLFAITKLNVSKTHPYRSRMLVSYMYRCMLADSSKAHDHDIVTDRLRFLDMLKAYITMCTNDERYQGDAYIAYMLDSLRILIVVYLAVLIKRSCTWKEFQQLGSIVATQKLVFHESIVKEHKELHKLTGVVNQ